jgi:hypothetical protein
VARPSLIPAGEGLDLPFRRPRGQGPPPRAAEKRKGLAHQASGLCAQGISHWD